MITPEQKEYLQGQSETKEGKKWLELLRAIADKLYYSKGVALEDVKPRQIAAGILENIVTIAEEKEHKPKQNNEYV
jgi:hypothetical protein